MYKSSYYHGKYGSICGIHPSKLPIELLQEVDMEKLSECIKEDKRVEEIISTKIESSTIKKITFLKNISDDDILQSPAILKAYNDCIKRSAKDLDGSYVFRNDFIREKLLDNENKMNEVKRWLNGLDSVVNESSVDYTFLFEHFPDLADAKIKKILSEVYTSRGMYRMIATLPKNKIPEIFPEVMKRKTSVKIHVLCNQYTPKEFIIKALKCIGNKVNIPDIKIKIDEDIIKSLPTITRLDVVETLLNSGKKIDFAQNFKSKDELANLLFSSAIRYPDRVERAVQMMDQEIKSYKGKTI